MSRFGHAGLGSTYDSPPLTNGVRITPKRSAFGRTVAVLALVTAALGTACVVPAAAEPGKSSAVAKKRAQQHRALIRSLKRDPRVATKRWFIRKAALFGV